MQNVIHVIYGIPLTWAMFTKMEEICADENEDFYTPEDFGFRITYHGASRYPVGWLGAKLGQFMEQEALAAREIRTEPNSDEINEAQAAWGELDQRLQALAPDLTTYFVFGTT